FLPSALFFGRAGSPSDSNCNSRLQIAIIKTVCLIREASMRILHCLIFVLAALLEVGSTHLARADDAPADEPEAKNSRLKELIEESVDWYEVLPEADAGSPLLSHSVLSWQNSVRGEAAHAMMVVWTHHGRPEALASIFPWNGFLCHEFGSLSRDSKLVARDK